MAPNFKMGNTNALAFDKIGFQNKRLRLDNVTSNDIRTHNLTVKSSDNLKLGAMRSLHKSVTFNQLTGGAAISADDEVLFELGEFDVSVAAGEPTPTHILINKIVVNTTTAWNGTADITLFAGDTTGIAMGTLANNGTATSAQLAGAGTTLKDLQATTAANITISTAGRVVQTGQGESTVAQRFLYVCAGTNGNWSTAKTAGAANIYIEYTVV